MNVFRSFCLVAVVAVALLTAAQPAAARERTYYIAADEVLWNYAPSGRDLIAGTAVPKLAPVQLGWLYHKLSYRAYTDATFTKLLARPSADRYLGIVGPVLHAEVGDTIVVVFKNHAHVPLDVAPGGGLVGPEARLVAPGGVHTYRWSVPASAGPGPGDPSSTLWTYGSNGPRFFGALMAGLHGPIVVTRSGGARADGSPADVDREVFTAFMETDESASDLFEANLSDPRTNPRKVARANVFGTVAALTVSINGYSYGNMPMVAVHRGTRVRWYLYSTSSSGDFHAPTWNGQTVVVGGHRVDSVGLNPSTRVVADMVPDETGIWLLYCTLNIHLDNGMKARYQVTR